MGWPDEPRGSGSRSLGSTRRSHARPGRAGELTTGGSQAGAWSIQKGGIRNGERHNWSNTHRKRTQALESAVLGNLQAAFGGGPGEKGDVSRTSPVAYPTSCLGSLAPNRKPSKSNNTSEHSYKRNSSWNSLRLKRLSPMREARMPDFSAMKSLSDKRIGSDLLPKKEEIADLSTER